MKWNKENLKTIVSVIILVLLFWRIEKISSKIDYRADRAESQRTANQKIELADRKNKTDTILKSNDELLELLDSVKNGIKLIN